MNKLAKPELTEKQLAASNQMFDALLEGKANTARDLATQFNCSISEVAKLITSNGFAKRYNEYKTALANLDYDTAAYDRGNQIIREGSEKNAIAAIKVMGEVLGKIKKDKSFNQQINVNLDGFYDKLSKTEQDSLPKLIEVNYPGFEE